MNAREIEVGEEVFCRQGDAESILATTHRYTIVEILRSASQHVEVRVKNSLGEDLPGWFPIWPHFEPYTGAPNESGPTAAQPVAPADSARVGCPRQGRRTASAGEAWAQTSSVSRGGCS